MLGIFLWVSSKILDKYTCMKNLKTFENHSYEVYTSGSNILKGYGEEFPFSNLSVGDKLVYMGAPCEVYEVSDTIITLQNLNQNSKRFTVNQNMFNKGGFISKKDTPAKLK